MTEIWWVELFHHNTERLTYDRAKFWIVYSGHWNGQLSFAKSTDVNGRCAICLVDHEVEGCCTLPCQHRFCFESLQHPSCSHSRVSCNHLQSLPHKEWHHTDSVWGLWGHSFVDSVFWLHYHSLSQVITPCRLSPCSIRECKKTRQPWIRFVSSQNWKRRYHFDLIVRERRLSIVSAFSVIERLRAWSGTCLAHDHA